MKNLFIIGKAGAGKSEVGAYLEGRWGCGSFALADALKYEIGRNLRRTPTKADRALMIEFGQSYRRWFGQDVWCAKLVNDDTFGHYRHLGCAVVEDGRHAYEYDYFVVQRGFVPVRIVADDETRFDRLLKRDGVDQRAVLAGQETELDGVEVAWTLHNNGTIDELYRQIDEMIENIRGEA